MKILLIGDTILNRTVLASPSMTGQALPFTFLNEELLVADADPQYTLQGVGHIARLLCGSRDWKLIVWTGVGGDDGAAKATALLRDACDAESRLDLDGTKTRVVTRVLRNVGPTRMHDDEPQYRAHLRIESHVPGEFASLDWHTEIGRIISQGDICVVRALTPSLFGHTADAVNDTIEKIQQAVLGAGSRCILDLRPIPPGFRILDPETVMISTLGRLRDHRSVYRKFAPEDRNAPAADTVLGAYWRFAPVKALVSFCGKDGVISASRGIDPWQAAVHTATFDWPRSAPDGCGLVGAGDALVASAVAALARGVSDFGYVARACADAYRVAYSEVLGSTAHTGSIGRAETATPSVSTRDSPLRARLMQALDLIPSNLKDVRLFLPPNGKLRASYLELSQVLDGWQARKGRDLVAVFGESRSGKEFLLASVLREKQYRVVGPVNMHQFLSETRGCINELLKRDAGYAASKTALIIDEVTPGDSTRSLLNLLAEKKYRSYLTNEQELDFSAYPVILLSSIRPADMLEDLRGRLAYRKGILVPSLDERWDEIPFHMARTAWEHANRAPVWLSHRYIAAFIQHDYRPRDSNAHAEPTGMEQRNFRALEDLLLSSIRTAASTPMEHFTGMPDLILSANRVPAPMRHLVSASVADNEFLQVSSSGEVLLRHIPALSRTGDVSRSGDRSTMLE